MFANRYTALVDSCVLIGALKRNLLLTLAEAEFFRLRYPCCGGHPEDGGSDDLYAKALASA